MFKNTQLLILLLCFCSTALVAQKSNTSTPTFKKIEKAKQKRALNEFTLFSAVSDARSAGISKETVKEGQILDLDLATVKTLQNQNLEALQLSFPLNSEKNLTVSLVQNKVLTPDFNLRSSSNRTAATDYNPGLYYTGVMEGDAQSLVSISIFDDEIIGTIHTRTGNIVIGKLEDSDRHIIYNDIDLGQSFDLDCGMEDDGYVYRGEELRVRGSRDAGDCVRIYIEIDDDIVTQKGGVTNATNYVTGIMNEVITLYANDNMAMAISEILAWDTPAPYSGGDSGAMLNSYQANTGAFNGDLSHLVSYQASGGIAAGFSGICNSNVDNSKCFSSIGSTYNQVPAYSYTVMVMAHEMGHLIGSRHTHACVWNGNGTAIDGCAGFVEGGCPLPPSPPEGGTIMSYCHVATGIDFTQGFGPQPQAVLLNTIANANCLSGCAGPTCDDGILNGDETGIDCGGSSCPACESNCDDNTVNVNFVFDNYPEETSWTIVDANGATVGAGGTYPNQADGSSLTIPLCLVDGCYDFTIFDTYGDGICCSYGNGSYTVTDGAGNTLASGGEFTSSELTNICVGGNGTPISLDMSSTAVTCFGGDDGTATVTASGGSGTYTYSWSNGGTTATISNLTAGTYTVAVSDGNSTENGTVTVADGTPETYYADADNDGFGDANNTTTGGCTPPAGYVTDNSDCNDGNNTVYPGAPELCDELDNNCNGQTDEGVENTYYADTDGDGFGDPNNSTTACSAPAGYVTDNTDCNDGNNTVYPGATEVCDGVDNNCNGQTDENGSNTYYADTDGDGFGDPDNSTTACSAPAGYVTDNTDCNDGNNTVYPGATEVCDGVDNNCNGQTDENAPNTYYADTDGDGFGDANNTANGCSAPAGYVTDNTDCDDGNANIYIGATCDDNDPNTTGDVIDANCNCIGTPVTGCTDNEVTLNLNLDNYPGETTWQLTNAAGSVLYSGGTYPGQQGVTITETFCLPDDCYDFTINDSYGDGICCGYGNGSYSVVDANGNTLAAGGNFGSTETTNFCFGQPLEYCGSQGNNTNYEYIDAIGVADLSNNSGNDGGYADYTNLSANVSAGQSVDVTLTPGFANTVYVEQWRVWIDYNQDGDFDDAGETVFSPASSNSTITGSFTVPGSATAGATRMRISMKWGGSAPTPCESFTYGEVEDYTIVIGGGSSFTGGGQADGRSDGYDVGTVGQPLTFTNDQRAKLEMTIYPNPIRDRLTVTANLTSAAPTQITILTTDGKVVYEQSNIEVAGKTLTEVIELSGLVDGVYFVRIVNGGDVKTERFSKMK